ncbi:MAG TPA: circularly permuted type 2 ATP-grasp protein, partial [Candidatus Xenobia bacterium]
PHGIYLHLYGADLGRLPDGTWCVCRDRTQAPAGPAYSLENRFIVSRTLPDLFRDCHAERLAPFFRTWRESLPQFAPRAVDTPRLVVLSPGAEHESYFEHAYLARYLGYTLVEGEDLTVRDGAVYLKTVSRLHPVDVILRRIDDRVADPLELEGGGFVGVTGLLEAVRQRRVTVINALGSGVAHSPALLPFLPALCRDLLGEELLLPSIPTLWCGQPEGLAQVEQRLSSMVLEPCFARAGQDPIFGDRLTRRQRTEVLDMLREQPAAWVAQERVGLATMPLLSGDRLTLGHGVLRTFGIVRPDGGWEIMPGGLVRTSTDVRNLLVSVERSGGSKDCWIVSTTPLAATVPAPASVESIELRRGDGDMPSRVADTLYWLGRYIERSESTARILRSLLIRTMDRTDLEVLPEVPVLMRVLTGGKARPSEEDGLPPWERLQHDLLALSLQPRRAGSLKKWLNDIGRLSLRVRDRWTPDAWRVLTQLTSAMHQPSPDRPVDSSRLLLLLNRLMLHLAAFSGLAYENMTRNLELRITDIGRRMERALQMIELLDVTLGRTAARESTVLEALLEIGDSAITYRQ